VGAHRVVLEPDAFAFADPRPDKGAAQIQNALFAFSPKSPLRNIASPLFFPEGGDVLP
jgi:hypothetical protein